MQRITLQGQVRDGTHNITNNTQTEPSQSDGRMGKKNTQTTAGEELTNVAWR